MDIFSQACARLQEYISPGSDVQEYFEGIWKPIWDVCSKDVVDSNVLILRSGLHFDSSYHEGLDYAIAEQQASTVLSRQ